MEEKYFVKAMELAEKGRGKTSPNPFVGAVIVKNDEIIGEGFTQPYGQDHAEIQALKEVGEKAKDAEMYVTLEPCAHYGKTPPCVDAIIDAGIKKIYIGIIDPNELVNGKGIEKLKNAKIEVETGIMAKEVRRQLEYYLTFIKKKRPFVIMKNAVSLDGKIATEEGFSKWITSQDARRKVHLIRSEVDAIITGLGTIINDNPMLNVRIEGDYKSPVRIILDEHLSLPLESKIVRTASEIRTIVCKSIHYCNKEVETKLKENNVEIISLPESNKGLDIDALMEKLYEMNFTAIMIESGSKVCTSFLEKKLVDKVHYFMAPKILGGGFSVFQSLSIKDMDQAISIDIINFERIGIDYHFVGYIKY